MSQAELSKKVGVSQTFISQIENGIRSGTPKTMQLIAKTLNCNYEETEKKPKFFIQFLRNCKLLSQSQLKILNEMVIELIKEGKKS